MPPVKETSLKLRKGKVIFSLLICCILLICGLWLWHLALDIGQIPAEADLLILLAFFLCLFAVWRGFLALRRLLDPTPGLLLNNKGISYKSLYQPVQFVPWTAIEKLSACLSLKGQMIGIHLFTPEKHPLAGTFWHKRYLHKLAQDFGTVYLIPSRELAFDEHNLRRLLVKYYGLYKSEKAQASDEYHLGIIKDIALHHRKRRPPENDLAIPLAKGKMFVAFLVSTSAIILFCFGVFKAYEDANPVMFYLGLFGLFCFLVLVGISLFFLLKKSPRLILSQSGIYLNTTLSGNDFVPWEEVTALVPSIYNPPNTISIRVNNPEKYLGKGNYLQRWHRQKLNKKFDSPLIINNRFLKIKEESLSAALFDYFGRTLDTPPLCAGKR